MPASSATDIEIAALDRAEIVLEPWTWRFAVERRADIEAYFADLCRKRAGLWNGRVLLLNKYTIADRVLRGACFETDFASLCAWRAWNFPDASVCNVFAAAALRSADGAFLVGEMGAATANAGMLYFPCGTPEPADVSADGGLDLFLNLGRELLEETGIDTAELQAEPGWTMVRDRRYIALLKAVTAPQPATELRARIMDRIRREQQPEFVGIRLVRSPGDFDPAMPRFVSAFLTYMWSR